MANSRTSLLIKRFLPGLESMARYQRSWFRYETDSNQEFIALGVADLGAGLMQGFCVSGADSRTTLCRGKCPKPAFLKTSRATQRPR